MQATASTGALDSVTVPGFRSLFVRNTQNGGLCAVEVSSVAESARVVRTWESDTNFHLFLRAFGTLLSLVQYLGITRGVQEFRDSPGDDLHEMFFPNPYPAQCLARQWTR